MKPSQLRRLRHRAWLAAALAALAALAVADPGLAGVRETTLDNGLRVVVDRSPRASGVAELLLVAAAGTKREGVGEEGAARLTAHALFAGAAPGGGRVSRALTLEGAEVDIDVEGDVARFHLVMPAHRLEAVLSLVAELLARPRLPDEAWSEAADGERRRRERRAADPVVQGERLLTRFAWGPPPAVAAAEDAGRRRVGHEDFRRRTYGASGMVLAAWGDLEPAATEAMVRRHLAGLEPGPAPAGPKAGAARAPAARPAAAAAFLCLPAAGLSPPLLLVGRATAADERSAYGCQALAYVLGGSHSSRLLGRLRGEEALAYNVDAGCLPGDGGGLTLRVSCQTSEVERSRAIIEEEIARLTRQEVAPEELGIAVAILRSRALLVEESALERMRRRARELLGVGPAAGDPQRAGPLLDDLTPADLLELARGAGPAPAVATVLLAGQPLPLCAGHWKDARTLR